MDMAFDIGFISLLIGVMFLPLVWRIVRVVQTIPRSKRVGPTYWGIYEGRSPTESPAMQTIMVRQPTFQEIITAGSSVYASGKPVNSLRR